MTRPVSLGFLVGATYKPLIKSLSLNFLAGTTLDSRITFSRGTNATLVDSTGKLTYAPNNLIVRSEEFDNATWSKINTTVSANITTAPNGTFTADKLVETTAVSTGHYTSPASIATAIGQRYVLSVYAKAGERTFLQLITTGPSPAGGNLIAGFDLINGTAGTPSNTATSTITPVGDGWYRCSMAFPVSSGTTAGIQIRISTTTSTSPSAYTGDGTSGLFLWGAQIELVTYQNSPSTYVRTTTAAYHGPRFDFDPVTLAPKGLLVESQRTNNIRNSMGVEAVAGTPGTMPTNWLAGSSGSGITREIIGTGMENGVSYIDIRYFGTPTSSFATNIAFEGANFIAAVSGQTWTQSLYLKLQAGSFVGTQTTLNMLGTDGTSGLEGFGSANITSTPSNLVASRLSVTATFTNALITHVQPRIRIALTSGVPFDITLRIGLPQIELAAFATSVIPTATAQATRSSDSAVMTGTNFSSWFNTLEGTFVVSASTVSTAASKGVYAASDGTNSNRIYLSVTTEPNHLIVTSGSTEADITISSVVSNNTVFRDAFAYRQDDVNAAFNGILGTLDTPPATLPVVNQFRIGARGDGSNIISGHICSLDYYPVRWADAQLPSLTL